MADKRDDQANDIKLRSSSSAQNADMHVSAIAKASIYALKTVKDSCILMFRQFFPLLLAWAVSLGVPVVMLFVCVFAGGVIDWLRGSTRASFGVLTGLLIPGVLIGVFWAGWIYVSLKVARGQAVHFKDMFRPLNQMLSALVALSISSVFIGLGMFVVIPGLLLFLKWQLTPYYIVDANYGPIRALRQSWHDTERIFVPLAVLDLIFLGLHTVSSAIIVGPILCHMALAIATGFVYAEWLGDDPAKYGSNQVLVLEDD